MQEILFKTNQHKYAQKGQHCTGVQEHMTITNTGRDHADYQQIVKSANTAQLSNIQVETEPKAEFHNCPVL